MSRQDAKTQSAKSEESGVRIQEPVGCGFERPTGGEPLWNVPKDFVIFFPVRGRPNIVLNRRLPGITARDVLPIAPLGNSSSV
jgi:hypothetical protein